MRDLTLVLPGRAAAGPEVWEALGRNGINVEGGTAFLRESHRVIHVLVNDEDESRAMEALSEAGLFLVDNREVLVIPVEDRPGIAGEITRKILEAGVTSYIMYLATNNRLVLGVDDVQAARRALT